MTYYLQWSGYIYNEEDQTHRRVFSNWVTLTVHTVVTIVPDPPNGPFTVLDPFYQDRIRNTVEEVLQETDGVDIRTWALQSDFNHVTLEAMTIEELVEILTHVAIVGR